MVRRLLLLLLVLVMVAAVAGCGRKGKPETPEGSRFPRTYPTQ